jgi:hypothetical protein
VNTPAQWFRASIAQGLVRLVALSLPGTPPADTIELTREAWIEALWPTRAWDADLDAPRIAAAFRTLMITCERWPAPVALLRALPARPHAPALPPPPASAEQRRRAGQILAAVADVLRKRHTSQ